MRRKQLQQHLRDYHPIHNPPLQQQHSHDYHRLHNPPLQQQYSRDYNQVHYPHHHVHNPPLQQQLYYEQQQLYQSPYHVSGMTSSQHQLTRCTSGKKRKPLQPLTNDNKSTLEQRQKKKPAPSSRNIVVEVDHIPDIADLLVEEIIDFIHDGGDGDDTSESDDDLSPSTSIQNPSPKKSPKTKKPLVPFNKRIGQTFDPPTVDAASTKCVTLDSWKKMKYYCDQHPNLTSPIPPASDGRLEDINTLVIKHFPGDVQLEKMKYEGLLHKTVNGYVAESCLRFLISTPNSVMHSLNMEHLKINGSLGFTDICMSPGPNNCGGDHNMKELQTLTTEVIIDFIKECPNLKNIVVFGKKPNIWAVDKFLPRLKTENLAHLFHESFHKGSEKFYSPCRFLCHSQFFLMQLNTKKHTLDLMRYVGTAIKAFLDIDIMDELISMGDDDLMDVVEFADDAVLKSRRQIMSQVMTDHWADPNSKVRKASEKGWLEGGTIRIANEERLKKGWLEGGTIRIANEERLKKGWLEGGTIRKASEKGWLVGGTIREASEKGWGDDGEFRLGWADPNSKFWKGCESSSKKMKEKWADPEGPYAHVSQLMIEKWADPKSPWAHLKGPYRNYRHFSNRDCIYCKASFCISSIRRHQEVCTCNPEYQHKIQGHLWQQKQRLQKYTPSQNDVILQTDGQHRKNHFNPELNGNVIFEESIKMHSAYLKKQRKSCKERSKVIDKIIKTIEERGYFVRYFESSIVQYKPIPTNQIRQEINKTLNNLGYYIE
jgi:hypothetical protein